MCDIFIMCLDLFLFVTCLGGISTQLSRRRRRRVAVVAAEEEEEEGGGGGGE